MLTRPTLATLVTIAALAMPSLLTATQGTLSASPAVVMLAGTPGQSTTQTLIITNATDRTIEFAMKAKDVVVQNGERIFVDAGRTSGSIAETATFSRRMLSVTPGETARVDVTLTIPQEPSGRAVVALFESAQPLKANGMNITASVGTLLTFALSDNVSADASAMLLQPPSATSNLLMTQQLVSSGTEPLVAKGMLAIVNESGALVGRQSIPARRLLPGEKAEVRAEYGGDLASGRYRVLVTYDLDGRTVTSAAELDVP